MTSTVAEQNERIARWREAFCDNDTGINKTIQDLLWNYAAFRTAVRIVYLSNSRRECGPPLNQMLFDLVAVGFWSSLLLGTRRLLDKASISGPKGVFSIRSVIRDVEMSRDWLSRKVYIERVRNVSYDVDRLRQEQYDKVVAAKGRAIWGSTELIDSDMAHRHFDALSGVSPFDRNPNDLIQPEIFAKIEKRLADLDLVSRHVGSHVAHAGNKQSRLNKDLSDFDIREAREVLRHLKEIADLVGLWFANECSADLPTYIGDQFDGLDHAVIDYADLADLNEQWYLVDQDIRSWSIKPEEV